MSSPKRLVVWGGGVVFVLSLAACAYVYAVVWATPSTEGGAAGIPRAAAINTLLFGVFALHHSLFAREPVKRRLARLVPDDLLRSVYVWMASLLLLATLACWQPMAGEVYHVTGWLALGHAALQFGGVWLSARAVARIDPLELAGIKPDSGRATAPRPGDVLHVEGPYRWVRHPLYLGWVLVVFGAAHMTADRFAFAVITTAYVVIAIPWEERSLLRLFGEPYARYRRTVRWRLVPYLY